MSQMSYMHVSVSIWELICVYDFQYGIHQLPAVLYHVDPKCRTFGCGDLHVMIAQITLCPFLVAYFASCMVPRI
jgi:hypothetical protein